MVLSDAPQVGPLNAGGVVDQPASGVLAPIVVFAVSRAFLAVLAWAAPHLLGRLRINPSLLPHHDPLAAVWAWSSPWFRFDASWYVGVAEHGYRWGSVSQTNTNFFPLYPLLIRLVQPLTMNDPWFAALVVSNASFLAALILLYRWAIARWERSIALRVILLVVAFPFSFFFAAPYAEPLFLALAIAAFLLAENDQWALATLAAGLSGITRPVGLAVVAAIVILAYQRRGPRRALIALCGVIPFLLFVLYLGVAVGHPLGFAVYHTYGWVPPHGGLITTIASQFHTRLSPFDRIDATLAALFLLSAIAVRRRIGLGYAVFVLLGVLLPLSKSLAGMERYVIVLFPSFAAWATWRSRVLQVCIFAIFVLGLVIATTMFADGYSIF